MSVFGKLYDATIIGGMQQLLEEGKLGICGDFNMWLLEEAMGLDEDELKRQLVF